MLFRGIQNRRIRLVSLLANIAHKRQGWFLNSVRSTRQSVGRR